MLCRVEMPTNEQIFGRFYRYKILRGGSGNGGKGFVVLPILLVILLAFSVLTGVSLKVVIVLLVVVAAYLLYMFWWKPVSIFRKKEGAALQTEVFVFTETFFTHSVRGEGESVIDHSSTQYSALHKVVQTSKDFYLFTSPTKAYLVDKEYFTNGSPEELAKILKAALGDKFK